MSKRPSLKQINDSIFLLSHNNAAISSDTERETGRGNCSSTQLDSGREKETRHGLLQQTIAPYLTDNSGLGGKNGEGGKSGGGKFLPLSLFSVSSKGRAAAAAAAAAPAAGRQRRLAAAHAGEGSPGRTGSRGCEELGRPKKAKQSFFEKVNQGKNKVSRIRLRT